MSTKRIITFIIWTESPGGIEKTLMYYPLNLTKYEYHLFILRPLTSSIEMFPENFFAKKIYGDHSNTKLYIKLFKYARNNKESIFHVLNAGPVVLSILKMANCKKIIYHIRGTIYWKKKYLKIPTQILWKVAVSNTTKIIANSKFSKKMFLQRANKKHAVEVMYNPFNMPDNEKDESTCFEKQKSGLSVCYVGRLVDGKNLFLWLEIAKQLTEKFNDITFHFYGKGYLEAGLKEYASQLRIDNKLHFHGFLKNIELAYQHHDLLLFLSEYESFGNVVVESILSGTPVIAKPIPSIREIFYNYSDFLLDEHRDYAEQISERLINIGDLKSKALYAIDDFKERFSLQKHLKKIEILYDQY